MFGTASIPVVRPGVKAETLDEILSILQHLQKSHEQYATSMRTIKETVYSSANVEQALPRAFKCIYERLEILKGRNVELCNSYGFFHSLVEQICEILVLLELDARSGSLLQSLEQHVR